MKQLLANFLFSLVTGASFVLGAFGVAALFDSSDDKKTYKHINQPDGFQFHEHSLVEGEPLFTVHGKLVNEGEVDWASIGIVARVYAGGALMTHCNENIRHVKRQSTRNFRLTCTDTAGSKLPDNISYTLEVVSGSR